MNNATFNFATVHLNALLTTVGIGTWNWDIPGDSIQYSDDYLKILGYVQSDIKGSIKEWRDMTHPDDLLHSTQILEDYLSGKLQIYECEIRIRHKDGHYVWVRDVGKAVDRDSDGAPTRLIGGLFNIDDLKNSERQLTEALEALEHNNLYLESEISNRTKELVEQEKLLWTVNKISRNLLTFHSDENFDDLVRDCLRLLGESINQNRVYIWKDRSDKDGRTYYTQIYEWMRDTIPIQDGDKSQEISYDDLPAFKEAIDGDKCLNSLISQLSESEKRVLSPQGIKTILIAPIAINGMRWGFIGVDNCESEELFTDMEENMLLTSGSLLANTIERMDTEARLHEMETRTQLMLDATPLCCNLWTPEFNNMSCNEEAVRLFALTSQQEYLERFNDLSPKFQPCGDLSSELALTCLKTAFKDGYLRFNWLHQKLDGTPIPAEITLVRVKYKDGFIVAGYTRDLREFNAMLSEIQSKEDDLRAARDEALLSSKAKSNFLANMSHEIRTPMNAISGLAEIILRESKHEKTSEYAKEIKSASNNLLNIINDILDISKIESGKLEIYNSQYELASLLNDVITISRIRLGHKPLMFVTNIDSHLPSQLMGDEIRIKQILINLLSNAIKFTQEGYISFRVSGEVNGNQSILRFSVKDSGLGIKEPDLEGLFADFERINTTKNRNIEGTGLGLPIAKQLCEMMNGSIEVQSTYGEGSEFTAIIPQEVRSQDQLSLVRDKKNILLYEPRDTYRLSIAESLENLGCICVSCSKQSELYDNISKMTYNYVLTTALHLKKVKALVKKKHLPVPIATFADFDESVIDSTVYNILFPVSCLQLANLLNGDFDDGDFSTYNSTITNFSAPTARVLIVDDNAVNLRVAEGLMAPYQFTIDTAINGIEAIRLVKEVKYDLVFMDHMMPEMDGIDATIAIRHMKGYYFKNLPIVALTANALVGTREVFIREGMNDFLAKPIEINKLSQILLKWLPQSKIVKLEASELTTTIEKDSQLDIDGINTTQGILSVGGSKENYLQILSSFYADSYQTCSSLLDHINEKDISAFRTEIHALKSTCATIGALEVSSMAAKLETAAQQKNTNFIDNNLDPFLTSLKTILQSIGSVLPKVKQPAPMGKRKGDLNYLSSVLDTLYDAAEIANINQIEEIISQLQGSTWSKNIDSELLSIQECLSRFDYDGVLNCVIKLKEM